MTGADYSSGGEDDVESELDAAEDDNDSREEMSQYMRGGGGDELSRSGYAAGGRPRLTDADHHFLSYLRISPVRQEDDFPRNVSMGQHFPCNGHVVP